jgi:transposase InsO family protein
MNKKYLNGRQLVQYRGRVLADAERLGPAEAARRYGIDRSTVYEWRKSAEPGEMGPKGRVPWQTDPESEAVVIALRKATNYGPKRLARELLLMGHGLGEKAIRGIVGRAKLVKSHKKKRVRKQKRFYAPYPGYRLQVDTKAVPDEVSDLRKATRHQFTAIDIATRIRFLMVYGELSTRNSIDFLRRALGFFSGIGIAVECVQTDNHITFTNLYAGGNRKKDHGLLRVHPLTRECLKRGISHLLSRPGTPRHNCFVERSHRTDEEEFYRLLDLTSLDDQKLQVEMGKWMFRYNCLRIHSSCNNMPPVKYFMSLAVGETGA